MAFWKNLFGTSEATRDQPEEDQRREAESNPMFGVVNFLESCDILRSGTGEFGSESNPIPVNGPTGEILYLNRLRSPSGVGFMFHRVGTLRRPVIPYPMDAFELVAVDGSCWHNLYFSMYHPRRSRQAPRGLSLSPWPSDKGLQVMLKFPGFGAMHYVHDFPLGLPAVLEESPEFKAISPGLGGAMARRIQETLAKSGVSWRRPPGHSMPIVEGSTRNAPPGTPTQARDRLSHPEIQNVGISVVAEYITKDGGQVLSMTPKEPQIIARLDGRVSHIVVRTACYPDKGEIRRSEAQVFLAAASHAGADLFFASVGIANADATSEKERSVVFQGSGMHVSYAGLQPITPENIR